MKMQNKGYKQTEKHKENKNKKLQSEKNRQHMSDKMKGRDVSGWQWKTAKKIRERFRKGEIRYDGIYARNWQGGKCKETQALRMTNEYKEWRMKVFIRDNFTCQACGIRGGKLNAHHIRSFRKYPELRLVVDNGVTLCEECHNLTKGGNFKN